ncbi:MAG TPA: DHHW family protein [Clostridia bacterium]|nr:DHHW family protein [Clostridia bacterium]
MKNEKRFLTAVFALWGALLALSLFFPKKNFSELENRYLAPAPNFTVQKLLDGSYMKAWEAYMSDHFAFRDTFVHIKAAFEIASGKTENNGMLIGRGRLFPIVEAPNEETLMKNTGGVKAFAQNSGVPTYVLLAPSAAAVYQDALPKNAPVTDELSYIEKIYVGLSGAAKGVPIAETLLKDKDAGVYYRTDHHWTTYGAYLAYSEAAKLMGLPDRAWEEFQSETVSETFLGTLHSKSGVPFYTPDSIEAAHASGGLSVLNGDLTWSGETGLYFPEWLEKKDQYSYFLGTMQAAAKIKTAAGTGRRLVLFKDSYAHCFAPFLTRDYDEILLVDLRYANARTLEFLDVSSYDDALFLYSFDEFSHTLGAGKLG